MPPLIGQLDYREWLRAFYEERKSVDAFFSYRFLADKVGMDHSLLIKVIQGDRHLADGSLDRWVSYLKFDKREDDYFRTLVKFCKTRSSRERTQSLDRLLTLQGTRAQGLEADQREYFRDWQPVAMRSLIGIEGRLEASEAGARLDPPMTAADAQETLALLERLRLIRREADGRWALSDDFIEAGPSMDPQIIRDHQKQMMRMAAEAIDRHPPKHRQVSAATITLSVDDLPEARERIRALRDSLLRLASESRTADQVFHFQAVLFPLTKVENSTRRRKLHS
ncbi:MAG: TIGR02147 family protein [Fibrobacterota bacterium]